MTQTLRRQRRGANPVDLELFYDQVESAMTAFSTDVSYAVLMARAAVTITRKREVWKARREQRRTDAANRQDESL